MAPLRPLALSAALVSLVALVAACGPSAAAAPPAGSPLAGDATIAAKDIAFDRSTLELPADESATLVFDNQEAVPHNVAITDASGKSVFEGEIFSGPAQRAYVIPPLAAGTYKFLCTVHPNMAGELTVR